MEKSIDVLKIFNEEIDTKVKRIDLRENSQLLISIFQV